MKRGRASRLASFWLNDSWRGNHGSAADDDQHLFLHSEEICFLFQSWH